MKKTGYAAYLPGMKRLAYVTDLHLDEAFPAQHGVDAKQNWLRVLDDIRTENISHLVIGGDIGEASALPWFFSTLAGLSVQLTLGNHDQYAEVQKHVLLATNGPGELFYQTEDEAFSSFLYKLPKNCFAIALIFLENQIYAIRK